MAEKFKLVLKDSSKDILEQLYKGAIYYISYTLLDDDFTDVPVLASSVEEAEEIILEECKEYYGLEDSQGVKFWKYNPGRIEEPNEFILRALTNAGIRYRRY